MLVPSRFLKDLGNHQCGFIAGAGSEPGRSDRQYLTGTATSVRQNRSERIDSFAGRYVNIASNQMLMKQAINGV